MVEPAAKDHWEALFDSNYLRWYHLNDQPSLMEIVKVEGGVEMTLPGGLEVKRPVIHLKQLNGKIEEVKPLVLNKTNGNSIATIANSHYQQWAGHEIVLYPTKTKMYDKTLRKMVEKDCIRIRAKKESA